MPPPDLLADVSEIWQTRYMGFASFAVLLWDHIVTFGDEVEYIWKGEKSFPVYLFFLNRYLVPLSFIVNLVAYTLQSWDVETCKNYVRYEGAMTVIGIEVVGLMMLVRVSALYKNSRLVVGFVATILVAQTVINAWLLSSASAVTHAKNSIRSCTMIFAPTPAAAASAWIPLLYDTIVLLLTFHRLVPIVKQQERSHVLRSMLEDGLLYYSIIFSINLILTVMIVAAPPGLKNITAQLELVLTVAMMSRITLHLKAHRHLPNVGGHDSAGMTFSRDRPHADAKARIRGRSFALSADGAGAIVRPTPLPPLTTISSERSPPESEFVMDIFRAFCDDTRANDDLELHELNANAKYISMKSDEESLETRCRD